MTSRRVLKVSEAIREVVSMAILTEINDPRVADVTVTSVEMTPDLRQAKVNVSIMGSETKQNLCLHGLRSSAGFLQSCVASRIDTRYTPRLEFVLDMGVKKSIELAAILKRVLPPDAAKIVESPLEVEPEIDGDDEVADTTEIIRAAEPDLLDPSDEPRASSSPGPAA